MHNGFIVRDSQRNRLSYDGKTLKFGITVDGVNYIVKLPKNTVSSVFSEYVASRFIQSLGIAAHDTWLGYYNNTVVVILKDFTTKEYKLRAYKDTRQSSEDTDLSGKTYSYSDVINLIEKHTKLDGFDKQVAIRQFWGMFICDAILGNRDRHQGNWGYLASKRGYKTAPLYDNGASLFPDVQNVIEQFVRNEYIFLVERSERFPASLFQMKRETGVLKRTNYYEMLSDLRINKTLAQEVRVLREKVGFNHIFRSMCRIVNETSGIIPPVYCRFYIMIVCMRYLHLIERVPLNTAYKRIRRALGDES